MGQAVEQGYAERAATTTRELAEWFDTNYARPGLAVVQQSWMTRPVFTTFAVILVALSATPVLLFSIFAIVVSINFVVIGLGIAVVSAATVIALAGEWYGIGILTGGKNALVRATSTEPSACCGVLLVGLLILLVFVAVGLTAFFLSTLFACRYVSNVRTSGMREGTAQWVQNAREQLSGPTAHPQPEDHTYKNGVYDAKSPLDKDDASAITKE